MTSHEAFNLIAAVDLSTVANIATALTVLTAVVFGLIEMRRARKEREERAALVAVQAILTPAWPIILDAFRWLRSDVCQTATMRRDCFDRSGHSSS